MNLKRIIKEVMELREEVNDFNWIDDSDDMRDSEWRQAIFDLEYDRMKKSLYKNQEKVVSWVKQAIYDAEARGDNVYEEDVKHWINNDLGEVGWYIPYYWQSYNDVESYNKFVLTLIRQFIDDTYNKFFKDGPYPSEPEGGEGFQIHDE
jgi:hypothetical protein